MKTANSVCGKCAATIPADTQHGLCPACLLQTGLGLLDDEPAVPQQQDRPDGTRIPYKKKAARPARMLEDFGDYELLEEIGRRGAWFTVRDKKASTAPSPSK